MLPPFRSVWSCPGECLRPGAALVLAACSLACSGCGGGSSAELGNTANEKPTRVLSQQLGLVRPGQKVLRHFTITNDSQDTWTLAQVHSHCACIIGRTSAKAIAPGQSMDVELQYTAGQVNLDDERGAEVAFAEASAPLVALKIQAQIREPICIFPPSRFAAITPGQPPEASFEVHNCTDHDVQIVSLQGSAPWLSAQAVPQPADAQHAPARQVWKVIIHANTENLAVGRYPGQIEVKTDCPGGLVKVFPIEFYLKGPVEAIPPRLAFGAAAPGTAVTRKIVIRKVSQWDARLANAESGSPLELVISHDLGEALSLQLEAHGNYWDLQGTLTLPPRPTQKEITGQLTIHFQGRDWVPLLIPVSATIKQP